MNIWSFLQKVSVINKDKIPPIAFQLTPQDVAAALAKKWNWEDATVTFQPAKVVTKDALKDFLHWHVAAIQCKPLQSSAYLFIPKNTLLQILTYSAGKEIPWDEMSQALWDFLLLQFLSALNEASCFNKMQLIYSSGAQLPSEEGSLIDFQITSRDKVYSGSVLFPFPLQQEALAHYGRSAPSLALNTQVGFSAMHMQLSYEEWNSLKVGDLILLNKEQWDPSTKSGKGVVCIEGHPLFNARYSDGKVHLEALQRGDT